MRLFCLIIFYSFLAIGQSPYPKDFFGSPLDIPLQLSGNFGELRPNHFHSGFDFKTNQKEGLNVYAAADGYVSRIKISEGGYGKAIYITHNNGFTTVYGHLQSGVGRIEEYIKTKQYEASSYEIDVYLKPQELLVKKGELIAISGNTGGSDGPHLHYEIRDTTTEKIINPLYFGYDTVIKDTKSPDISTLLVYPLGENSTVNQSNAPIILSLKKQKDGNFISEKVLASGAIGFGIIAQDYDDVSWNANGVYKVASFINGKENFSYLFDTFSFDETRYVNALLDYARYKSQGQKAQKVFAVNAYPLSIVNFGNHNGIVEVLPNVTQTCTIVVSDFNGNSTKVFVPIQYSNLPARNNVKATKSNYFLKAKRDNIFEKDHVSVTIPANTFLNDFYLDFEVSKNSIQFHKDLEPAFGNFSITFEDSLSAKNDRDKMFIGLINGKKTQFYNTKRTDKSFTIYTKYLGQYKLLSDTVAPKIRITKEIKDKWISQQKDIQLLIDDDLSGIKSYNGYLNGKWVLFEYESKTKKIIHRFSDGLVQEGKNDLKVEVTDNVGNSAIFETQFFRSQKP